MSTTSNFETDPKTSLTRPQQIDLSSHTRPNTVSAAESTQIGKFCRLRRGIAVIPLQSDQIQVGFSPEYSVVFDNLDESDRSWFNNLDSGQAKVSSKRQSEFAEALQQSGLTEGQPPLFQELRIVVRGLCAVGTEIAFALANSGVRCIELADNRPVDFLVENLLPSNCFGLARQIAVRRTLQARHQNLLLGRISKPDLVIVAGGPIPNLSLVGRLMAKDLAHLLVCTGDREIRIGPLVVPGTTACSICLERVLIEKDPQWLKLRQRVELLEVPEVSAHLRQAAAALTVHMIEQLANCTPLLPHSSQLQCSPPSDLSESRHLSVSWRIFNRGVETEWWSPHPKCLCTDK